MKPSPPEPTVFGDASTPRSPRRRRVMVVDYPDSPVLTLAQSIAAWGHEVRVCQDPRMALEEAGDFEPDVALLGVVYPGLDGCELAQQIRSRSWGEVALLVALTDDHRRCEPQREAAVFDVHLVRPVGCDVLRRLLEDRRP